MKFLHTADIHLGAKPDAGTAYTASREREIWNSFQRMVEVCESRQIDLLLIAGDFFHRQPLLRELKEVSYLFGQLTHTHVVIIAGNHDHVKYDSYYKTYRWPKNVHMLLNEEMEVVEFPEINTAVYGFSYKEKEIKKYINKEKNAEQRQQYEILLLHGGDESHIPFQKAELLNQGFDYVALGHIHKPQSLVRDKIAYSGALEPIDKNDTGQHGYILGEIDDKGCRTSFVPSATREYCHIEVKVTPETTGYELKEEIHWLIKENGKENIYKIILTGYHDPETRYDLSGMDVYGNIIEISDQTVPSYDFEQLMKNNERNILGDFIRELKDFDPESIEYGAMCEGVKALMETRGE